MGSIVPRHVVIENDLMMARGGNIVVRVAGGHLKCDFILPASWRISRDSGVGIC